MAATGAWGGAAATPPHQLRCTTRYVSSGHQLQPRRLEQHFTTCHLTCKQCHQKCCPTMKILSSSSYQKVASRMIRDTPPPPLLLLSSAVVLPATCGLDRLVEYQQRCTMIFSTIFLYKLLVARDLRCYLPQHIIIFVFILDGMAAKGRAKGVRILHCLRPLAQKHSFCKWS